MAEMLIFVLEVVAVIELCFALKLIRKNRQLDERSRNVQAQDFSGNYKIMTALAGTGRAAEQEK